MRPTGPTNFKGNRSVEYEGEARKVLGQLEERMRRTKQTHGRLQKRLSDGTLVSVASLQRFPGAQPLRIIRVTEIGGGLPLAEVLVHPMVGRTSIEGLAEIVELFLESGYVKIPWPLHDETPAGDLYFTNDVSEDVSAGLKWFWGYAFDVWPATSDDFGPVSYSAGMDSKAFPAGHAKYQYQYGEFLVYPEAWNTGTQNGKLLAMWQAMAGSRNPYNSVTGDIHGPFTGYNGMSLHTTVDGVYYLVKIDRYKVQVALLSFKDYPATLLAAVKAAGFGRVDKVGSRDFRAAEQYILANADERNNWTTVYEFPDDFIVGFTIYYGWASNWHGTESTLVTHESLYDPPESTYHADQVGTKAHRYTLSIESIPDGGPYGHDWACAIVEAEAVEWGIDVGNETMWIPNSFMQNMRFAYMRSQLGGIALVPGDAPIYAWYGGASNNDLHEVRFYRETPATRSNTHGMQTNNWIASIVLCPYDTFHGTWYNNSTGVYKHGFYIKGPTGYGQEQMPAAQTSGTIYEYYLSFWSGATRDDCFSSNSNFTLPYECGSAWTFPDGNAGGNSVDDQCPGVYHGKYVRSLQGFSRFRSSRHGGTVNVESALAFSYKSSQAVLLYTQEYIGPGDKAFVARDSYGTAEIWHVGTQALHPEWSNVGTAHMYQSIDAYGQGYFSGGGAYARDSSFNSVLNDPDPLYRITATLAGLGGETQRMHDLVTSDFYATGIYATLFSPPVFGAVPWPFLDRYIAIQQSQGGKFLATADVNHQTTAGSNVGLGDVEPDMLSSGLWIGRS